MATQPDPATIPPAMALRLARDNQEYGRKLAGHEFQAALAELRNPRVFELSIDFPNDPAPDLRLPLLSSPEELRHMPRLNVTLGSTAWHIAPEGLPVIGIYCPDEPHEVWRAALTTLLTAHYIEPFARFVFLCSGFRLVPFLGRYQFVYEMLGPQQPLDTTRRLETRFGMKELRHLVTADSLWRAPSSEG